MTRDHEEIEDQAQRLFMMVLDEYFRRILIGMPEREMDWDMQIREIYKSSSCDPKMLEDDK